MVVVRDMGQSVMAFSNFDRCRRDINQSDGDNVRMLKRHFLSTERFR